MSDTLRAAGLTEIGANHVADSLLTITFAGTGDIEGGVSRLSDDQLDRLDGKLARMRDTIDDERTLRRLQRRRRQLRSAGKGEPMTPFINTDEGEDG